MKSESEGQQGRTEQPKPAVAPLYSGLLVWCHAENCSNLIHNGHEHMGTRPSNRRHVVVSGVPYCLDSVAWLHEDHVEVHGVVIDPEELEYRDYYDIAQEDST